MLPLPSNAALAALGPVPDPAASPLPQKPAAAPAGPGGRALAHPMQQYVDALVNNCAGVKVSYDPEFAHQARVSIRRLRVALRLLRSGKRDEDCLDADLKWLFGLLGAARDWDVFIAGELVRLLERDSRSEAGARLLEAAQQRRQEAYANLRGALAGPRYARLLRRLHRQSSRVMPGETESASRPPKYAAHKLKDAHEALMDDAKKLKSADAEQWHRLRIDLKKLRYGADLLKPYLKKKRSRPYRDEVEQLQEVLGRMNDLAQAERLLGKLKPEPALKRQALARLAADRLLLEPPARQHLAALAKAQKPWAKLRRHPDLPLAH